MITIGIDPGKEGAIAVLNRDSAHVYDLPQVSDKSLCWVDGGQLLSILLDHPGQKHAIVERISWRRGQGSPAAMNYGAGFGAIMGVLQSMQVPIELVTPAKWKDCYGLTDNKEQSLHKARLLFPSCELSLKKHHGRAEALLIAYYRHRAVIDRHLQRVAA